MNTDTGDVYRTPQEIAAAVEKAHHIAQMARDSDPRRVADALELLAGLERLAAQGAVELSYEVEWHCRTTWPFGFGPTPLEAVRAALAKLDGDE